MRTFAVILVVTFGCKQGEVAKTNRSPESPEEAAGPGQVKVETDPTAAADDDANDGLVDGTDLEDNLLNVETKLVVAGQVAVVAGLRLVDGDEQEVVAFEVSGSVFSSSVAGNALRFPIGEGGVFAADLPKKEDDHFYDQFFDADGTVDVQKARATLPPSDTAGMTDNEVTSRVREGRDYYSNIGFVLASVTSASPTDAADWISRLAARKLEADSMQFIALNAANNASLLGLPVQKAIIPKLEVGALTTEGDEAKSAVAVSETQFAVPQAALDDFATSNDGFKRIKNAYLNVDPIDKFEFNVMQVYSWSDIEYNDELDVDGFTKAALMETKLNGYTIRFETNRPTITLQKACTDGGVRLYPPNDQDPDYPGYVELTKNVTADAAGRCPDGSTSNEDKSHFFCGTNPLSNKNVGAIVGTKCESDWDNAPINYGYTADVETRSNNGQDQHWLRMNWGGDGGVLGRVPQGLWRFEIDGVGTSPVVAWYDLAKGFPLGDDDRPILYAPRIKITRDGTGSKKVIAVDLKLAVYNRATNTYEQAKMSSVRRVVTRSPSLTLNDFTPPSGQQNNYTPELIPVFTDGVTEANQEAHWRIDAAAFDAAHEWRAGFDANPNVVAAYWDIDNVAIGYEAYGTSYRFVIRDYDSNW